MNALEEPASPHGVPDDDDPDIQGETSPGTTDNPISSRAEDSMGRSDFADELAREILSAPTSAGYVIALAGAWGSGKTSILNMAIEAIEAIEDGANVIHFNPWMFSGTEALVSSYFSELSKQLERKKGKAKKLAKQLAIYGRLLTPIAALAGAGGVADVATGALQQAGADPSVYEEHDILRRKLAALESPLVIVLDDVDRLRPEEIRDIVRLVRLVGDFPNTVYVLAFDRKRVEECLGENDPARGRAYLEKIVQVTYDVPLARDVDLTSLFLTGLGPIATSMSTGPLHTDDWQNIFSLIIRPLLKTPRDVRRYLQALPMTLRMIGDEVALADVLGLEAIRVLQPDIFDALVEVRDVLGTTRSLGMGAVEATQKVGEGPLGQLASLDFDLASAICRWLFPAAGQHFGHTGYGHDWLATWRKARKVANPNVFLFYLERRLPDGVVPARTIDELFDALKIEETLTGLLDQLVGDELADALERLSYRLDELDYDSAGSIDDDPAKVALPVLLDQLPRMSPRTADTNPFGRGFTIGGIALRLIQRITEDEPRIEVVRSTLSTASVASARIIMLKVLGHRPNIGMGILGTEVIDQLETEERQRIAVMTGQDLASDPSPLTIASLLAETPEGKTSLSALVEDDRFMVALVVDSTGQASGRTIGAAAVDVTIVLSWDHLVSLLSYEVLIRRVAELDESVRDGSLLLDADDASALDLAARYATGWRPDSLIQTLMQAATGGAASPASDTTDTIPGEEGSDE
jgi:KAP-like P-loop domain-containing protein